MMEWDADSSSRVCLLCSKEFGTFVNRRHHCRACGRLVCDKCSSRKLILNATSSLVQPNQNNYDPSQQQISSASSSSSLSISDGLRRVCDGCYLSITKKRQIESSNIKRQEIENLVTNMTSFVSDCLIRIFFLDGSYKTLAYDSSTTILDLCSAICFSVNIGLFEVEKDIKDVHGYKLLLPHECIEDIVVRWELSQNGQNSGEGSSRHQDDNVGGGTHGVSYKYKLVMPLYDFNSTKRSKEPPRNVIIPSRSVNDNLGIKVDSAKENERLVTLTSKTGQAVSNNSNNNNNNNSSSISSSSSNNNSNNNNNNNNSSSSSSSRNSSDNSDMINSQNSPSGKSKSGSSTANMTNSVAFTKEILSAPSNTNKDVNNLQLVGSDLRKMFDQILSDNNISIAAGNYAVPPVGAASDQSNYLNSGYNATSVAGLLAIKDPVDKICKEIARLSAEKHEIAKNCDIFKALLDRKLERGSAGGNLVGGTQSPLHVPIIAKVNSIMTTSKLLTNYNMHLADMSAPDHGGFGGYLTSSASRSDINSSNFRGAMTNRSSFKDLARSSLANQSSDKGVGNFGSSSRSSAGLLHTNSCSSLSEVGLHLSDDFSLSPTDLEKGSRGVGLNSLRESFSGPSSKNNSGGRLSSSNGIRSSFSSSATSKGAKAGGTTSLGMLSDDTQACSNSIPTSPNEKTAVESVKQLPLPLIDRFLLKQSSLINNTSTTPPPVPISLSQGTRKDNANTFGGSFDSDAGPELAARPVSVYDKRIQASDCAVITREFFHHIKSMELFFVLYNNLVKNTMTDEISADGLDHMELDVTPVVIALYEMMLAMEGSFEFIMNIAKDWKTTYRQWILSKFSSLLVFPLLNTRLISTFINICLMENILHSEPVFAIFRDSILRSFLGNTERGASELELSTSDGPGDLIYANLPSGLLLPGSGGASQIPSGYVGVSPLALMRGMTATISYLISDLVPMLPNEMPTLQLYLEVAYPLVRGPLLEKYTLTKATLDKKVLIEYLQFYQTQVKYLSRYNNNITKIAVVSSNIMSNSGSLIVDTSVFSDLAVEIQRQCVSSMQAFFKTLINTLHTNDEKLVTLKSISQAMFAFESSSTSSKEIQLPWVDILFDETSDIIQSISKDSLSLGTRQAILFIVINDGIGEFLTKQSSLLDKLDALPIGKLLQLISTEKLCGMINSHVSFAKKMNAKLESLLEQFELAISSSSSADATSSSSPTPVSSSISVGRTHDAIFSVFKRQLDLSKRALEIIIKIVRFEFVDILKSGLFRSGWDNDVRVILATQAMVTRYQLELPDYMPRIEYLSKIMVAIVQTIVDTYLEGLLFDFCSGGSSVMTSRLLNRVHEDVDLLKGGLAPCRKYFNPNSSNQSEGGGSMSNSSMGSTSGARLRSGSDSVGGLASINSGGDAFNLTLKPLVDVVKLLSMDPKAMVEFVRNDLFPDFGPAAINIWQCVLTVRGESKQIQEALHEAIFADWSFNVDSTPMNQPAFIETRFRSQSSKKK